MSILTKALYSGYRQSQAVRGTKALILPDNSQISVCFDTYNLTDQSEIGGFSDDIIFVVSTLTENLVALNLDDIHNLKGSLCTIDNRSFRITGITMGETITSLALSNPEN